MGNLRISRSLARSDEELRREVEVFDPFTHIRLIPRGDSVEDIKSRTYSELKLKKFDIDKTMTAPSASGNGIAAAVQAIPLKDALMVVPEYNGENIPLSVFLEGCDEAKEMITHKNEANLTKSVRSKVTGVARKAIYGKNFGTIDDLKYFIKKM